MIVLMLDEDLNPALVADLLKGAGFKVAEGQPLALADRSEGAQTRGPAGSLHSKACARPGYAGAGSDVGRRSHR
jgi:hypothetical protein